MVGISYRFCLRAVAMAVSLGAAAGGPARAEDCLSDWGLAGEIIRQENLITVDELASSVLPGGEGKILKTTLCRIANGYVYRMVVQDRNGRLRTTIVPARAH